MSEQPPAPVVPQARDRVGVPWARRPWDPRPVSGQAGDWWAPGAVNPEPPARAVAEASSYRSPYEGSGTDRRHWLVNDLGPTLTVAARASSQGRVGVIGLVWVLSRRDRTVLVADATGLHLPATGPGNRPRTLVAWEDIAQLVTLHSPTSGTEIWHVERLDGSRVPLAAAPLHVGHRASELRSILLGVGTFPTRFGRPAVMVDGVVARDPGRHPRRIASSGTTRA